MNDYIQLLKNHGLKWTPKREAILGLFLKVKRSLTPEDVSYELKKKFDQCGIPSIYRNLESLRECGVLTQIIQDDNKRHYALCCREEHSHKHHHHHIVCVKCGKVDEVEDCLIAPKKEIKGFTVLDHFLQFDGVCPACK